jgi:protein-S-isoprenylcysteine O-methyltransferase Ste14
MAPIIVRTIMPARRPSQGALIFAWSGAALFAGSLVYFLYCYLVRFGALAPLDAVAVDASPAGSRAVLGPVAIDAALFGIFALHHSIAARSGMKARIRQIAPPMLERALYTWLASVLFILVCALWRLVPGELYRLTGIWAIPGYLAQSAGLLLTARSSARLDVLDLAGVRPVLDAGRGHMALHVPLETRGLYGLVRHPLYLAWVLFVFATPHMTATRFVFAAISSAYLAIAIPFEERSLIHTFGADYRAYQKRVRWRIIPGLY